MHSLFWFSLTFIQLKAVLLFPDLYLANSNIDAIVPEMSIRVVAMGSDGYGIYSKWQLVYVPSHHFIIVEFEKRARVVTACMSYSHIPNINN